MSTRFASALIACILMLSALSPSVTAAPLTALTAVVYVGNPIDAIRSIPEIHVGPEEGSLYRVLGYGI
ncbi:hypothetical protein IW262DRAFT_1460610 [Armillaria fumosa]|nr:hypothetical protein IW262DRAFT_1460610 [Armillaria fumosa]